MKNFKKFMSLFLSIALVLSVFGNFNVKQAEAASAAFFIPDDVTLRNTANRVLSDATSLTRDNVLISNNGLLSMKGTYQQVSNTSMTVTVDQIAFVGNTWKEQEGKTAFTSVPSPSENRFQINNLQLFPGYNRLTLSGDQGGVKKTDVFYVLYESGPVLTSLQLLEGNTLVDVNESSRIVTRQGAVVFQGKVLNATSVTVNGNRGSVTENGSFFSPGVILTPGLNKIDFVFKNASDTLSFSREIYYYDQKQPFSELKVTQTGAETHDIMNQVATFTGSSTTAKLDIEVLVPYQDIPFTGNSTLEINTIPVNIANATEEVVYGTNNQPAFKRIRLTTDNYNLTLNGTAPATVQTVNLKLTYGTGTNASSAAITRNYNVATGQVLIKNAYLLPTYNGTGTVTDATDKQPLHNSQVGKAEFHMLVESSAAPGTLKINFEPLGTLTLTPTQVSTYQSAGTHKTVYKVSDFPEGAHNLVLKYDSGSSVFKAKVSFVSKTYIQIDNLTDGQVIQLNSAAGNNSVQLKGQFIGFDNNLVGKQLFINNVDKTEEYLNPNFDETGKFFPKNYPSGAINLPVQTNGPLFYGENIIKFKVQYGTTVNGVSNVLREFVKEIKIYIVDTNTPNIQSGRPLTPPTRGIRGSLSSSNPAEYLIPSPEFQSSGTLANTYSTTLKNFDYFLEGSGTSEVTIKKAGEIIFKFAPSTAINSTTVTPGVNVDSYISISVNKLPAGTSLDYHGSRDSFRIRINDLPIIELGPHVYNVELTNTTGSPVTHRLEINRTTAPYRILSPKVNVGNSIVVNKNFVLFDVEAEGATQVTVNGKVAEKRTDKPDRFMVTVSGLRPDTNNKINLIVKRPQGELKESVNVYYSSDVSVDTMYMEELKSKHSVFNKQLELTFPRNTVLRRNDNKLYPKSTILFGIASPIDGVVGRINDYGDVLGINNEQGNQLGEITTPIHAQLADRFATRVGRERFTPVSPYYWISVGYAEKGEPGSANYQPATGGLPPYNHINTFTTTYPDFAFEPENRKLLPTNRGQLTLAFDPNIVMDSGSYLTVFHFNDKGEWKNLGGVADMRKKTITVPFDDFGYYTVAKLKYSFTDIVGHSWARNVLSALYSKGLMNNLGEDFGADDYTTRGEFAAILVKAMDLPLNYDENYSFLDVVPGSRTITWSYEEIETAARAGIIHGQSDRVFNPGGRITREEAATMIARALSLKTAEINDKLIAKMNKAFVDGPNISRYALPGVDAVYSAKLMAGQPADANNKKLFVFNPQANLTRAEAGQIMVNILKKYNKKFAQELS